MFSVLRNSCVKQTVLVSLLSSSFSTESSCSCRVQVTWQVLQLLLPLVAPGAIFWMWLIAMLGMATSF
ncbi:hypothetical protein O9993_07905 [Vibrio lentus]|nr:hypothetical protein [Vibrio lentus]